MRYYSRKYELLFKCFDNKTDLKRQDDINAAAALGEVLLHAPGSCGVKGLVSVQSGVPPHDHTAGSAAFTE